MVSDLSKCISLGTQYLENSENMFSSLHELFSESCRAGGEVISPLPFSSTPRSGVDGTLHLQSFHSSRCSSIDIQKAVWLLSHSLRVAHSFSCHHFFFKSFINLSAQYSAYLIICPSTYLFWYSLVYLFLYLFCSSFNCFLVPIGAWDEGYETPI